jgi:hypothetical protein
MVTTLSAEQTRAQDVIFVLQCSLAGLGERLPLCWPTPPGTPPSPKKSYRSKYVFLGWEDLEDLTVWEHLSDFDVVLRLVDFSGLRPVLAQLLGWASGRGWEPFDPVSLFLLSGWQIINNWSRAETLRNLRHPRYADYARRFGFRDGIFPTEGGVRYFLTTVGRNAEIAGETIAVEVGDQVVQVGMQRLNTLLVQAVQLIREAGLLSPQAWRQALICPDGQLHDAASRMRCSAVTDSCYQPTRADSPRPCPAQEEGLEGCDCDTLACASVCRRATPRDAQARFIWYAGDNQEAEGDKRGEAHYGYRSLPLRLADPQRRFSITLLDAVLPANQREENPAAALLLQLAHYYPDLVVETVAGDAGLGYEAFLHTVYAHLHARRVVAQRSHETDRNKLSWPLRGYDDHGRPLCPFGYAFSSNGFDHQRQRHKWICAQTCLKGSQPRVRLPDVDYPPPECPYQSSQHPHCRILNVGERFEDGSIRLVRDLPVGSPTWKALYHRARNAVEGRNATFEGWGLKRLPVYGLPRSTALLFIADAWDTLTTLARLIREAIAAYRYRF